MEEVTKLRLDITATKNDAFLLVTGAESRVREVAKSLEARILSALDGVPSEAVRSC